MQSLSNDVLGLIVDELDPIFPPDIRTLHSCLLVSRGLFQLAVRRLWQSHFYYDTAVGIQSHIRGRACSVLDVINLGLREACLHRGSSPEISAETQGQRWLIWRHRLYVQSVTVLKIVLDPFQLEPALITPLLGRIRTVHISTMVSNLYASVWLDAVSQEAAGNNVDEIIFFDRPMQRDPDFARHRYATTIKVVCCDANVEGVAALILNYTRVRNLSLTGGSTLNPTRSLAERIRNPSQLRQLNIGIFFPQGFLSQFTALTHIKMLVDGLHASGLTDVDHCAGTLTHLTLRILVTDGAASDCALFAAIGRLTNLTELKVVVLGDVRGLGKPMIRVLMESVTRLEGLRSLTIEGNGWPEAGLSAALAGKPHLRDLRLVFAVGNYYCEGNPFDVDERDTVRDVDLAINAQGLATQHVRGARGVVIRDLNAIFQDGWRRLESIVVGGNILRARPSELKNVLTLIENDGVGRTRPEALLKEVLLDPLQTPLLHRVKCIKWKGSEMIFKRGGGREFVVKPEQNLRHY
ncbi:hypothetical protein HK101_007612 [Irineochytrium annulatum]|nr:hypothetical protein HK101_007612 [Irineochytrium annulatum]